MNKRLILGWAGVVIGLLLLVWGIVGLVVVNMSNPPMVLQLIYNTI